MATNLDKSLDDIIASRPKSARKSRVRKATTNPKAKASAASKKSTSQAAANQRVAAAAAALSSKNPGLDIFKEATDQARRVLLSNLPTDVTEESVKAYFAKNIGPISRVQGSYNRQGLSTGSFNVTFRHAGNAAKAVKAYNGVSIDGGAKIMKVELIIDPTKQPLALRVDAPKKGAAAPESAAKKSRRARAKKPAAANGGAKSTNGAAPTGPAATTKKPAGDKKKRERRPKKTVEELDAEMADYFQEATTNAS